MAGMMMSPEPATHESSISNHSRTERKELQENSLKLRQTKRRLLLESAEQPLSNVHRLREILFKLSMEVPNDDDCSNPPCLTRTRFSSISSMISSSSMQ
jgi:hypothetical protein